MATPPTVTMLDFKLSLNESLQPFCDAFDTVHEVSPAGFWQHDGGSETDGEITGVQSFGPLTPQHLN